MELDIIQTKTTWNDAAKSINDNYVKIADAIAQLKVNSDGGGGYERMLANLNSLTTEGVEYYFAGRLEGDTPRWFVGIIIYDYG